ncbi:hypothetical protein PANDA_013667, partial [Ailuropoda melanoleuca]
QNINKGARDLNDTLDQTNLTDIFRTFHPKTGEYTFFSSTPGTFSRIDHILGHRKTGLNKNKRIEVIPCTCSDHKKKTTKKNKNQKTGQTRNTWTLNSMLLNNEWVKQEMKEEI